MTKASQSVTLKPETYNNIRLSMPQQKDYTESLLILIIIINYFSAMRMQKSCVFRQLVSEWYALTRKSRSGDLKLWLCRWMVSNQERYRTI